jgi:hypothetical protein
MFERSIASISEAKVDERRRPFVDRGQDHWVGRSEPLKGGIV